MYLIAIGWIYVILMVAVVHPNPVGGVLLFLFGGLGPLALFLWIFGTPARRRAKLREASSEAAPATDADASAPSEAETSRTGDATQPPGSIHTNEAKRPVTPSRR